MACRYWYKDVLPFAAMVSAECINVGTTVLFKAATINGMSYYVFIAYSYAIATLLLLPLSFIFRSTAVLPSAKSPLLFGLCLLSLIGVSGQIFGCKGLEYSSPTLASAISNLTPAFTFMLAVIFRMERLALRSLSTQAKIIGTVVSTSGALVVILYKGPTILSSSTTPRIEQPLGSSQLNWVLGGLLLSTEFLLFSALYIIQTQVMKIYPAELVVVFFYNCGATIISVPVCFIAEANLSSWRLRTEGALAAVIYSGVFGIGLTSLVHTWGLHLKGPVYIAIFKPLSIAIAAIMSFIILGDVLHLGSVIGAIIIGIGFYAVIWGKAKEDDETNDKIPLLHGH